MCARGGLLQSSRPFRARPGCAEASGTGARHRRFLWPGINRRRSEESLGTAARPGQARDLDERLKDLAAQARIAAAPGGGGGEGGGSLLRCRRSCVVAAVARERLLPDQAGRARRHPALRQADATCAARAAAGAGRGPSRRVTKVNVANVNSQRLQVARAHLRRQPRRPALCGAVPVHRSGENALQGARPRGHAERGRARAPSARSSAAARSMMCWWAAPAREITRRTKELIQRTLDFYNSGITVTTVNLEDVQVPDAVIPSQRDANKALADQERFIKEAQAYANGIIPVAQGAAARMQQDARGLQGAGRGHRRRAGVALHAACGGLRAGAGGHAQAPLHGHHRERARARPQGADRRARAATAT